MTRFPAVLSAVLSAERTEDTHKYMGELKKAVIAIGEHKNIVQIFLLKSGFKPPIVLFLFVPSVFPQDTKQESEMNFGVRFHVNYLPQTSQQKLNVSGSRLHMGIRDVVYCLEFGVGIGNVVAFTLSVSISILNLEPAT